MKTTLVDAVHTSISNDGIINSDIYDLLENFEHNREAVDSNESSGITSYYFDPDERNIE